MDSATQIVLLIMVIVLGITLVIVGVMIFFLLKDLRQSVSKVNVILDDVQSLSSRLSDSSAFLEDTLLSIRDAVSSVKLQMVSPIGSIMGLVSLFKKFRKKGGE